MAAALGFKLTLWLRIHRWTSLMCTMFTLVLCVSGLPLIFHDELTASGDGTPRPVGAHEQPLLSLAALAERVQHTGPEQHVQFVFWHDDRDDAVGLGLAGTQDAALDDVTQTVFDRRSLTPLPAAPPAPRAIEWLGDLHRNLLLGEPGALFLSVVAVLLLASLVSGVVVYGPFMRQLDFGSIRGGSVKLLWLDLHNLIGIATTAWALVIGVTGLMNTLEGPLFAAWQASLVPSVPVVHDSPNPRAPVATLDAAVAAAKTALPGMKVTSVGLAGTRYGTPREHLVWLHGTTNLTKRLFATVLVDADSGKVVQAAALPWYLRLLEVSRPLHFGDYGGMPLKILWAFFDVLLIGVQVSGFYLWWMKGRVHHATVQPISAQRAAG